MLKTVGTSGQLTLGKKYSGRHFELDELGNGELVLRPVRLVRESTLATQSGALKTPAETPAETPAKTPAETPAFQIAEVDHVVMPNREQRNARAK